MSDDNATKVITDIHSVLASTENAASDKEACLVVVGGELNGTLFDLHPNSSVTIGRSAECSVVLDFQGISRAHCKITERADGAIIEDLGSSNGTFLNNAKIEGQVQLNRSDMIKLGELALKYLPAGDPERLTYDKLHADANTDGLTKCFNKTYFNKAIETEVKKCKATGNPLGLIIFDLDHFKKLNDNFGHDAGDFVLKEMATLIHNNGIRDQDIFARYGGEEFVVLLPATNLKQAFEIAERLRKLVEGHQFNYEGKRLPVTASVGVADYRRGVESGTDLFKRADEAVYQSKNGGRNQVSFYKAA